MKSFFKIVAKIFTIIVLVLPLVVLAAGGGGGGGGSSVPPPPSCDADTWTCEPWASCQIDGTQSRTCALAFDCPTTNTPKPPTTQNCTPSCAEDLYSCTAWGLCDADGRQKRTCGKTSDCPFVNTPEPIETQTCKSSVASPGPIEGLSTKPSVITSPSVSKTKIEPCKQDKYECDDWIQCNQDGKQTRLCKLIFDCADVSTAKPDELRVCPGLRCGQLSKLSERISCRLRLTDKDLANEFKILYAPETCKSIKDQEEKIECIKLYQNLGPCWQISVGSARNACAKKTIGLDNITQGKSECSKLKKATKQACLDSLLDQVRYLTVFRMYDLEVRAETLMKRGVSENLVADLELFIETKKQEMYQTDVTTDWKRIIQEVQQRWREFISAARPLLKNPKNEALIPKP